MGNNLYISNHFLPIYQYQHQYQHQHNHNHNQDHNQGHNLFVLLQVQINLKLLKYKVNKLIEVAPRKMPPTHPQYLKQYTCHQHSNLLRGNYTITKYLHLSFSGSTPAIHCEPAHQLIDWHQGRERVYLCRWDSGTGNTCYLNLVEFQGPNVWRVEMDRRPTSVHVVEGLLYIAGGSDLYVIAMDQFAIEVSYPLGSETLHAVEPAFRDNDVTARGVAVYSWCDKNGYRKRFYSKNASVEGNWWTGLTSTIMFRRAPRELVGSELKIVIPNVLGLLIMPNLEDICLMNLATMQPVPHCAHKLTNWSFSKASRAIVKYYVNKNSQGFDDSLLVSIGQKGRSMIEVFVFHIKYMTQIARQIKQIRRKTNTDSMGLPSMTSGDAVDWPASVLETFFCYSTEGALIDYLLIQNGIIFYADTSSRIPISGFINYHSPLNISPILSLEHNICQSFLHDNDIRTQIDELKKAREADNTENYEGFQLLRTLEKELLNSVIRPNRYSLPFVYASIGMEPISQINPAKIIPRELLFNWHKLYKITRICIIQGDILIFRQNSISSLLPIDQKQYTSEYENGDKLEKYFENWGRTSMSNFDLSVNESNYSLNLPNLGNNGIVTDCWWNEMNTQQNDAFTFEKQGTMLMEGFAQEKEDSIIQIECKKTYEKYMGQFLNKITTDYTEPQRNMSQMQQINLKSLTFCTRIINNRVKDILLFYSKFLKYLFSKTRDFHIPYSSTEKKLQKILINYLNGLNRMLVDPLFQVNAHGIDLLDMFIGQEVAKLWRSIEQDQGKEIQEGGAVVVNVEKESWKIITKLFEDIVIAGQKPTVNQFIKMLILNIQTGYLYIQQILLQIFNPYPYQYFQQPPKNPQSNPIPIRIHHSCQQCHFPPTSTILSIYCNLPISDETKDKLFTSFIMQAFIGESSEKAVNDMIGGIVGKPYFRERVRSLYSQVRETNKSVIEVGSERTGRASERNRQDSNADNMVVDWSVGITQLFKIFDSADLENYLKKLNDKELDAVFRNNAQNSLTQNIEASRNEEVKLSNEDVLVGWIFKFRSYVYRLQNHIAYIQNNKDECIDQMVNNQLKKTAIKYIENCLNSLSNVRTYYEKLYTHQKNVSVEGLTNANMGSETQKFHESDSQIIEKICCRMVGFDNTHDLYIYGEGPNSEGNEKIYPNTSYFKLVLHLLNSQQIYVQTITSMESIIFFHLQHILEIPAHHSDKHDGYSWLKELGKYRSRRWLLEFIIKNGPLRQKFENLPPNQAGNLIRSYFPYSQETGIIPNFISNMAITSHKNISKQTNSKKGIDIYDEQRKKRSMQDLPYFRNSYLQAIGR